MKRLAVPGAGQRAPLRPGEWALDAACAGSPHADLFFLDGPAALDVLALCARCPVRVECLAFALGAGESYGVWGGLTPEERAAYLIGGEPPERAA